MNNSILTEKQIMAISEQSFALSKDEKYDDRKTVICDNCIEKHCPKLFLTKCYI